MHLKQWLDPQNHPDLVRVVDEIPRSFLNKMLRREVRAQLARWLAGTAASEWPVFALSSLTGDGVAELDAYLRRMAREPAARPASGLFRLAVIAQQIYWRFHHGQTKDERFAMLIFAVKILEETALKVIERAG